MDYYTGQILPIAFTYAPRQTALCAGQMIPVMQNQALFSLLGTNFGGSLASGSFGLPNTAGRTLVGFGNAGSAMPLGTVGGEAVHALTAGEMPQHTHAVNATTQGAIGNSPAGKLPGIASGPAYGAANTMLPLGGEAVGDAGGGQPHNNMQPSLPINFAIVLSGIYPSRS